VPLWPFARSGASTGLAPSGTIRKSGGYGGRLHQFTISTGSLDREGDTIAPAGWDIAGYLKNPVVLWAHDSRQLPIGTATNVWREGNALKAKMYFANTPVAQQIEQLLDDRVLRATSVGFAPKTFAFSTSGINFFEQELLEFSVVPVPANADALLEATTSAKDQRALDVMAVRVRVGSPTAAQRKRQRQLDVVLLNHTKNTSRDEALKAKRRHEREADVARLRLWR